MTGKYPYPASRGFRQHPSLMRVSTCATGSEPSTMAGMPGKAGAEARLMSGILPRTDADAGVPADRDDVTSGPSRLGLRSV